MRRGGMIGSTALAVVLASVSPVAAADSACVDASARAAEAVRDGRWAEAIDILEASIERPACRSVRIEQQFSLAYAIEQSSPDDPEQACRAEELYREVQRSTAEPAIAEGTRRGLARVGPMCRRCRAADPFIGRGDWTRAERILRTHMTLDVCAAVRPTLALKLARVQERLAGDDPQRACDAAVQYGEAMASRSALAVREARDGQRRMRARCEGTDGADAAVTPPGAVAPPDRTLAWVLTAGSGVALLTGGLSMVGRSLADDDRARAEADYEAAVAEGHADRAAAARSRFEDADDRSATLEAVGWTSLAVGVGLAVGAAWAWWDDGARATAHVTPGGAALVVRF